MARNEKRSTFRFEVADLAARIDVDSSIFTEIWGFYTRYPASARKEGLHLRCEVDADFLEGREKSDGYPGFQARRGLDSVHLSRLDAEGTIELADAPKINGTFKVSSSPHSLEAVTRVGMAVALPFSQAFMMHASCVATKRGAYIFAGVSGAGKSTISTMLALIEGVVKTSDELLIVAKREGRWRVYVTPFIGSTGLPHGRFDPVLGVYFIKQSASHQAVPMSFQPSLSEMLRHVVVYANHPTIAERVLEVTSSFAAEIPSFELKFAKDPGVRTVLGLTCCSLTS